MSFSSPHCCHLGGLAWAESALCQVPVLRKVEDGADTSLVKFPFHFNNECHSASKLA